MKTKNIFKGLSLALVAFAVQAQETQSSLLPLCSLPSAS